jgi:hypothetical protein
MFLYLSADTIVSNEVIMDKYCMQLLAGFYMQFTTQIDFTVKLMTFSIDATLLFREESFFLTSRLQKKQNT